MTRDRAPMSPGCRAVTIGSVAVLALVAGALFLLSWLVGLLAGAAGLALVAWAWSRAPVAYRIEPGALVVERRAAPSLRLGLPEEPEVVVDPEFGFGVRAFGNGGLFGAWGWFWSRRVGWFRVYARRSRPLVLVGTTSGRVCVAPERAEELASAVRAAGG